MDTSIAPVGKKSGQHFEHPPAMSSPGPVSPKNKGRSALVVDNDPFILEFMKDTLSAEGCSVKTARDGLQALDLLKTQVPDIIFVDLIMPLIDGKTLLRVIRHMDIHHKAFVVVLSATLTEEKTDLHHLGAGACIAKGPLDAMACNVRWVLDHPDAARSRCKAGEIVGIEGVYERRITGELLSVNAHLKGVLQSLSEGILEIVDGKVVYANDMALSLFSKEEADVLGARFLDLLAEDSAGEIRRLLNGPQGTPSPLDRIPLRLDHVRLELRYLPTGESNDNAIVILHNVTAAYQMQEALAQSREQMQEIISHNRDAMVLVDRDGAIRFANPAAFDLFNVPQDRLIGSRFGFPVSGDERIEIHLLDSAHQPRVAEMRVAELTYQDEPMYLASLRDITRRKEMEENLKQANQTILHQQKAVIEEERLRVLLQMAGATAHELRQPLNTLLGDIEAMIKEGEHPELLSSRLEKLQESSTKIANIVKKVGSMQGLQTLPYGEEAVSGDSGGKVDLLMVRDAHHAYDRIESFLSEDDRLVVHRAETMSQALGALREQAMDLVLTDHDLPDGTALRFMEALKEREVEIPVVVISRSGDELVAARAIKAGAADYLPMDTITRDSLSRSIHNALEKAQLNREIKKVTEKMAAMATMDELTGLYNRRYAMDALAHEIARAKRYHPPLSVCMLDLDDFKAVNDRYGHPTGDRVLRGIGQLMGDSARQLDTACRYGGRSLCWCCPIRMKQAPSSFAKGSGNRWPGIPFTRKRPLFISPSVGGCLNTTHKPIKRPGICLKKRIRPCIRPNRLEETGLCDYRIEGIGVTSCIVNK
ncbi:MAG: response regulator [Deltaproteobacteria bacterium]|nr:response regulator [Deltaproteobacteria bacterium]